MMRSDLPKKLVWPSKLDTLAVFKFVCLLVSKDIPVKVYRTSVMHYRSQYQYTVICTNKRKIINTYMVVTATLFVRARSARLPELICVNLFIQQLNFDAWILMENTSAAMLMVNIGAAIFLCSTSFQRNIVRQLRVFD